MTQLVWFRNDLRLDDNPALYYASAFARKEGQTVRAIYCVTPGQWQEHNEAPAKLAFRRDALVSLRDRLAQLGIELSLLSGNQYDDLPDLIFSHCERHKIKGLWFNRELLINEQFRDQQVVNKLKTAGVESNRFDTELLISEPLRNQQGSYYKVFTPWYRAWLKTLSISESAKHMAPLPDPEAVSHAVPVSNEEILFPESAQYRDDLWPADEQEALQRLQSFAERLPSYLQHRDFPAINGTSTLSPYLASGLLSPRRCLQWIQQTSFAQDACYQISDWRESDWLRELGWREFYRYLMVCFPSLCKGQPFKTETAQLQWLYDSKLIDAWRQGQTGFPIIDAGMRQLVRTGWMHNRLRMLTASFFCKLMLHDWRIGEQFFMQNLLDGDFASNNGGWQWSASTGCDASPWFRIFNPIKQSEKFDPDGVFIRKMVPELAGVDAKVIHNPPESVRQTLGYPNPILDYSAARERVLTHFKQSIG